VTSIQTRLTLWLLGSVVILLGLHWLVTSRAPVIFTEEYVATRLEHDAETLINGLHIDETGMVVLDSDYVAPIYFRLNAGHYYLIRSQDYVLTSRSLGSSEFNVQLTERPHGALFYHEGPDQQKLLVWAGHYEKDGHSVSLAIAEEMTTLDEHLGRFRWRFGAVTLALFALLVITQRVIVRYSLKPLERMQQACRKLETGDIKQLPENVPVEVKPLANEINRLVGVMQHRLVRSRNALGNLAHGLKTPLALLSQLVNDRNTDFDANDRQQAQTSVALIQSIINRELKRARLAGPESAGQKFNLNAETPDITDVLSKIYADKQLEYRLNLAQDDIQYGDREDMLELLGNLLDNASKWAKRKVVITASLEKDLRIAVEDDGPGIPESKRDALAVRGKRLDEAIPGSGLGLSIVMDIVNQYEGDIRFSTSKTLGGLRVDIALPTATFRRS